MKDLRTSKKPLLTFLTRYNLVLFVVVTVALLSVAILLLNGVVGKASGNDTPPQSAPSHFDQATIDRIKELKTSDQPSEPLNLSNRRINPFSE